MPAQDQRSARGTVPRSRCGALVLAVLPLVVGAFLWLLSETVDGWDGLGFLLALILSIPFLTLLAGFSVVLAFREDGGRRTLRTTSRVASVVSLTVFGGLVAIGSAGVAQSLWF